MTIKTDICVIGAGSGGLSVAAGAVQMGAKVVLIEKDEMGGDCLNTGCVPSKALLAAGHRAAAMRKGGLGVSGVEPQIDYAAAMGHVQDTIDTIAPHDSQERFEGLGCTVLRGAARFTSHKTVQVGDQEITARRFVIATGSTAFVPPIPGLDQVPYLTNENLWQLREQPKHLIVIGAGPIGLEMAQAHRRLGSEVTVIEAAKPLGQDDPELAAMAVEALESEGVRILSETAAESIESVNGGIRVNTSAGPVDGSQLLVAVGRKVSTEGLDLHKGQIEATRKGVTVTDSMRSVSNRRVYAIGDVAGGMQFTHLAGYHAGVIIRSMMFGLPAKARTDHIPRVTYISPEMAQVGLTEAQAREKHGDKLTVLRQEFAGIDRAIAEGRTQGLVKLMVVKGRPVGASIFGPDAGNLISTWAVAIANKHKLTTLTAAVLPYPTMAEINKRVAGAYFTPTLFDNPNVKRVVKTVQRLLP